MEFELGWEMFNQEDGLQAHRLVMRADRLSAHARNCGFDAGPSVVPTLADPQICRGRGA